MLVAFMARIIGCHWMAKGDPLQAAHIASSILRNGLEVNQSFMGVAAWGYFIDLVPADKSSAPLVVFSVEDTLVERYPTPLPSKPDYAIMKMRGGGFGTYVPITVLGFLNLPRFPPYQGWIGYF
jgi:hypothetical protein